MPTPSTVSQLASIVDFGPDALAILSVFGVLLTFYVTYKGASFVLNAVQNSQIERDAYEDEMERERNRL